MDFIFKNELLQPILVFLIFSVLFILIVRELITWYWKINQIVKLQEDSLDLLKQIELNVRPKSIKENVNLNKLKVDDGVRLTEAKKSSLRDIGNLKDDYKKIGKVYLIEDEYAHVYFGHESVEVKLTDLELVN